MVGAVAADLRELDRLLAPRPVFPHCQRVQCVERVTLDDGDIVLKLRYRGSGSLTEGNRVFVNLLFGRAGAQHADDEGHVRDLVLVPHILHEGDHVRLVVAVERRIELVVKSLEPHEPGDLVTGSGVVIGVVLLQVLEHIPDGLVHHPVVQAGVVLDLLGVFAVGLRLAQLVRASRRGAKIIMQRFAAPRGLDQQNRPVELLFERETKP